MGFRLGVCFMLDSDVLAQFSCDAPDLHSITRIGQGAVASDAWQVPSSKSHSYVPCCLGPWLAKAW